MASGGTKFCAAVQTPNFIRPLTARHDEIVVSNVRKRNESDAFSPLAWDIAWFMTIKLWKIAKTSEQPPEDIAHRFLAFMLGVAGVKL